MSEFVNSAVLLLNWFYVECHMMKLENGSHPLIREGGNSDMAVAVDF